MKIQGVVLCVIAVMVGLLAVPIPGGLTAETKNMEKTFSVKELKEDFKLFRTAFEEGHGAIYRYSSKEQMDSVFAKAQQALTGPMTEREFAVILWSVAGAVNCGHTSLRLSKVTFDKIKKMPLYLPFNIRFIKGKAYLFLNYDKDIKLEMGGEVLAINTRPIADILRDMLPLVPSDAHIETSKYRKLNRTSYFSELYYLLYGKSTTFTFLYRLPSGGKTLTVTADGLTREQLSKGFAQRYPEIVKKRKGPALKMEYREDGNGGKIAIITIRSFGQVEDVNGTKLPDFLAACFKTFNEKKIRNLIVDLRNNGGGRDDYGKFLFAHLTDKPFDYYESLTIKRIKHSFWSRTPTPDMEKRLAAGTSKNNSGTYDVMEHPNLGTQQPLSPMFSGNVFVLINGGSFSATGECTSLMHFHKKALFIGEECGAGYYGNTSGLMPTVTLGNTQIRVPVPMMKYSMAVSGYPKDRGLVPDHKVAPRIEDLLKDHDTVLEYTLNLVKKKMK
ncbi:MAG: hypothetical protein GY765_40385 [bacterium]|nr:hypothetical protein [bacterium]